jgi:hypothetical protein
MKGCMDAFTTHHVMKGANNGGWNAVLMILYMFHMLLHACLCLGHIQYYVMTHLVSSDENRKNHLTIQS